MAMFLADDVTEMSFGVQASNMNEVAQFSSTIDNVVVRMFTNNGQSNDNLTTGVAIGSSNYDKTGSASNNLYFGHITGGSNIKPVMLMQSGQIAINTVPASNYSLTVTGGVDSDTVTTPFLAATNVNDTFRNIAANTYINTATVFVGTPLTNGFTTLTMHLNGNSLQYTYNLVVSSNNATVLSINNTIAGSTSSTLYTTTTGTFVQGSYTVQLGVTTPGTGTGSSFQGSNLASFTVGATDTIGTPFVIRSSAPTFSTTNLTTVSGLPYYTSGTTVTFPTNSIGFSNIYNVIDPRTIGGLYPININGTSFEYSSVFTNVTTANSTNTAANPLQITLSGAGSEITVPATVFNVNLNNLNFNFLPNVCYLGNAINEASMAMATFTGLPVSSVNRYSVSAVGTGPTTYTLASYSGTPSSYDSFYSPFDSRLYPQSSSVVRGSFSPTFTGLTGTRPYVALTVSTTAPLSTFVINLAGSSGISSVFVQWVVASSTWYDATVLSTSGGCGGTTYTSGALRLPVTLPSGLSLPSSSTINIVIGTTGNVYVPGISLTYT